MCGLMVQRLDRWTCDSEGRGFNSLPRAFSLGKLYIHIHTGLLTFGRQGLDYTYTIHAFTHTYTENKIVPLSPSSKIWYWWRGGDAFTTDLFLLQTVIFYSHIFQSLCCGDELARGSCWLFSTPEQSHTISFTTIQASCQMDKDNSVFTSAVIFDALLNITSLLQNNTAQQYRTREAVDCGQSKNTPVYATHSSVQNLD